MKQFGQKVNNTAEIRRHTEKMEKLCSSETVTRRQCEEHLTEITFLQNERTAHLLVMLGTAISALIALLILILHSSAETATLFVLITILAVPYFIYYFFLENTIQYWYLLYRKICRVCGD